MAIDNLRITKLRTYLFSVIYTIVSNTSFGINADMLSDDINNYSLDKIPTLSKIEPFIIGGGRYRDVFSFRSRKAYSQDEVNNLENVGFYETFSALIENNNKNLIFPDIEGIEEINCLNGGSMTNANTNTAEFAIQIEIIYKK